MHPYMCISSKCVCHSRAGACCSFMLSSRRCAYAGSNCLSRRDQARLSQGGDPHSHFNFRPACCWGFVHGSSSSAQSSPVNYRGGGIVSVLIIKTFPPFLFCFFPCSCSCYRLLLLALSSVLARFLATCFASTADLIAPVCLSLFPPL